MGTYKSNIPRNEPVIIEGYENFESYYPACEMQTKDWLISTLKPDSVFFDVGANVGILSLTAGKVIDNSGLIISIEPTKNYKLLKKNLENIENKHMANTLLINKAIGEKNEYRKDSIYKIWGKAPEYSNWHFVTIDDLVQEYDLHKVDVIKIDTDGYELEVLKGAQKTLNQFYPSVIVEINEALQTRSITPELIFDFFLNHRYTDVLLLDDFNYVFSSNWKIGDIWPSSFRFTRWRKNSSSNLEKGNFITNIFRQNIANKKIKYNKNNHKYSANQIPKWNYLLDLKSENISIAGPVVLEIQGKITNGKISCAILADDYKTLISNEDQTDKLGKFRLSVQSNKWTNSAVIRTVSDEDFEFEIYEINLFEGVSSQNLQNDLNQKWKSCINEIKLFKELMSFFDLNPTNLNTESRPTLHSNGWLMEQSSSWLLVEIAKSFSKPKILEIGTWEGYTASILLKNTDAFIWTIDRDERIDTSIYPSRYSSLSSPDSQEVGWLYKTLDYENRVKEIISDSTLFNWDKFEDETFDIVFIDGDHSENAAYLDTINSFPKLRKSGICIWDDFSFDGFSMTDAERGVTNFVENNLKWLNDNFELAYLHGTQFLLGKKR